MRLPGLARPFALVISLLLQFSVLVPAHAEHQGAQPQTSGAGHAILRLPLSVPGMAPVTLYAEEIGRGPPVVLLHGLAASGHHWRRVAPLLARRHRVISIDLKGFGRSDKPFDTAYGVDAQASLLAAFLTARGLQGVTLVGHSYGGLVALTAALAEIGKPAARIARLVLVSTPAFPQPLTTGIAFLRMPVVPYVVLNLVPSELAVSVALLGEAMGIPNATARDVDLYAEPLRDPGGVHAIIETARQLVPRDTARRIAKYRRLKIPTLVASCRHDAVVPHASGVRLARMLERGRFAVLKSCEHMPAEQTPVALARLILDFARH